MSIRISDSLRDVFQAADVHATNIAASPAYGEKGFVVTTKALVTKSGNGGYKFSGTTAQIHQRITEQGEIVGTGVNTNVAIDKGGFIAVKNEKGEILLTRMGDFSIDEKGFLRNSNNFIANGLKLDDAGRLPGEFGNGDTRVATDINTLESINVNGLASKPKETTSVKINGRLDSAADLIDGAGQIFKFDETDTLNYTNTDNDIIIPSGNTINQGDKIVIDVNSVVTTYEYGGVMSTYDVTTHNIFGANSISDIFTSFPQGTAANDTTATIGDQIRITVGSKPFVDLKFVSSSVPRAASGEFNSLNSLKDALNYVPGLKARIAGNSLHIIADDGVSAVTFANVGGGGTDFKKLIGLTNIPAYGGTNKRFSTLGMLKTALQDNINLRVRNPVSGGGIDIQTKDPLQDIKFTSVSERKNAITHISATQGDPAISTGAASLAKFTIHSPQNKLNPGDFVRIVGLSGNAIFGGAPHVVPDGTYVVLSANTGGFTISADMLINTGGVGVLKSEAVPAGSWQKVPGIESGSITLGGADTINRGAPNSGGAGLSLVTISHAGHTFVNNDVVYVRGVGIAGAIAVPEGLYRVSGVAGNNFNIVIPHVGAAAASGPTGLSTGIVSKVGTSIGPNFSIQASAVFSNPASNQIRVEMPHHNFNIGDYVGIGGNPIDISVDNKKFKILTTTTTSFTFEVASAADATAFIAALTAGNLPAANYIDYFGKFDEDVNFDQAKDGVISQALFNPVEGSGSNLVTGSFEGTWTESVSIYDKLGIPHNFKISFAKIGGTKWAAQVYAIKNPVDNSYPIITNVDGIVANGTITFDGAGAIASIDGLNQFTLAWTNGSDPTVVKLDLGKVAGANNTSVFSSGGLTHVNGNNQIYNIMQDGYKPGKFIELTIDESTGRIIANYDNGTAQPVFMIPICYVVAPNELQAIGGAAFRTTNKSGNIFLKKAGDDSVGQFVAGAVEKSNINGTQEVMELVNVGNLAGILAAAMQKYNDTQENVIRRL